MDSVLCKVRGCECEVRGCESVLCEGSTYERVLWPWAEL